MKTVTYSTYGTPDVLEIKEISKPIPNDNEILVRIFATAANPGDVRLRKADPWAVRLFPGAVFSGEIEIAGKNVHSFKAGDRVFGSTGMSLDHMQNTNACLKME